MLMALQRIPQQTRGKMQEAMDRVSQACDTYDLKPSSNKTVVSQPAPGKTYNEPTITVNGHRLQLVDKFTCMYFGSTCTSKMR